jgi:alpha-tubulin suppressor-like RCC1 family protein
VPQDLDHARAVDGGTYHSIALKDDGTVVAWGVNGDPEEVVWNPDNP